MSAPDSNRLQALFVSHAANHGYTVLSDAATVDAFIAGPGDRVLLLAEDPRLVPESWDVAVVLPHVLTSVGNRIQAGLVPPVAAKAVAARHAIKLWPALLFVREGEHVGAIEGMRDWSVYAEEIPAMLERPTGRVPGVGIPVMSATGTGCS
ncbi:MAG TPA: hypothetical protein VFW68_07930 [Rhodocyclaceae bacterium]|nr:hypothetical protein [Rhodocyclaceae bacterium]